MNIFHQFQKDFNAQFSDMKAEAKPYTAKELYDLDYEKGMKDAANGVRFKDQGLAYTEGYFFQNAHQISTEAKQ